MTSKKSKPTFSESDVLKSLNSNNYYQKSQIDRFNKISRFGYFDPYSANTITREYLFFTKPDLHLFNQDGSLNDELTSNTFFREAYATHKDSMMQMQWSVRRFTNYNPFMSLLTNTVVPGLDLPDLTMETLETSANIYGIKLEYPTPVMTSGNCYDFNLEFEDTKNLDVYMLFRMWYEYELLKSKGSITPPGSPNGKYIENPYIVNRIIHDQISCYKITVGEDMTTVIHWAKLWGVYPTSIPVSAFSELQDGVLKIPVGFRCQFVEDMDPSILSDFNKLVNYKFKKLKKDIPLYDKKTGMVDGTWANIPYFTAETTSSGRKVYKMKWR